VPPTLADRVRHILEAITNIERVLAGKTEQDFAADYFLRLLVERLLEIVCEASRRVPETVKTGDPSIPWQGMIDFGNRLRQCLSQRRPRDCLEDRYGRPATVEGIRRADYPRRAIWANLTAVVRPD
jgi:uncharacterized protein with HEPN domain